MKKLIAELLIGLLVFASLAAWLLPSAEPTPAISTYAMQPDWASSAWAFSEVALAALPGLLVLAIGIGIFLSPIFLFLHLRARHEVEVIRARRELPEGLERLSITNRPLAAAMHAPMLEVDPYPQRIEVPTFAGLLMSGQIGPGRLILGYTDEGPIIGDPEDISSTAIGGVQGSGKSTTARFLFGSLALLGGQFVVCDPHGRASGTAGKQTLAQTLAPLSPTFLCDVTTHPEAILESVRFVAQHLQARIDGAPVDHLIVLAIDEFPGLVNDYPDIASQMIPMLEKINREGRKFLVTSTLLGQQWHVIRSGGGPLRSVFASLYIHRMRPDVARMLSGLRAAELGDTLHLADGEALLYRKDGSLQRVRVPNATSTDLERVGTLLPATPPLRSSLLGAVEAAEQVLRPATTSRQKAAASNGSNGHVAVSEAEQRKILAAYNYLLAQHGQPPSRRKVCARAFDGIEGGHDFYKTKFVLDEAGL